MSTRFNQIQLVDNIVHGVGGYSICYKGRKVIINTATNPMTNSNDL